MLSPRLRGVLAARDAFGGLRGQIGDLLVFIVNISPSQIVVVGQFPLAIVRVVQENLRKP